MSYGELARFAHGECRKFQIERKITGRGVVAGTLNLLTRVRESLPHQPLFNAVREIVRMTQLRERLRTLPREEFGDPVNELEKLLSAAAAAEARQESLADFALTLRRNFDKIRETEPAQADAIQLITAHKAKGSEWDAVIVPFLALDAGFFRGKRGVHTDTQLKWLQADVNEPNADIMSDLSDEATACEQTAARHKDRAPELIVDSLRALRLETGWVDIARQRAASILETVTPSQFAPEEELSRSPSVEEWIELEPELRPPRMDNPAKRYGVWWHDFAEQIDWRSEPKKWSETFARNLAASPDVARSKREWQLLQSHIESADGLGRVLREADFLCQEMPFFWRVNSKCLEGIVDLASLNQNANRVFILDWKTNRIAIDKIDILRELYRAQMAAYWQAISNLTGARVSAAIYSTATGQLAMYDDDELSEEWRRLSGNF